MMTPFAARLRALREDRGLSVRALAARTHHGKSHIHELCTGAQTPTPDVARRLDDALGAGGELVALAACGTGHPVDDELDAVELARRVDASDVSSDTLTRLRASFDDLASAYSTEPSTELIVRIRAHLAYVGRLMDARMTLRQRHELVTIGGWLSLLAATVHIDLGEPDAAAARLHTADRLAQHADQPEIQAWCLETRAWELLNFGRFTEVVDLSRRAQAIAPRGSSVYIQALAQEGRGWARMHQRAETRAVLDRVHKLVAGMPRPDRPEHHYVYDPDKALSYTATTLAWAGDRGAEQYARTLIDQLEDDGSVRPRRIALARLDLGLALLAAGQPDEAAAVATTAIASGRIVSANWWRAGEVLAGVERAGIPEAGDLRDAYQAYRPS